jgi:hypothetical protein
MSIHRRQHNHILISEHGTEGRHDRMQGVLLRVRIANVVHEEPSLRCTVNFNASLGVGMERPQRVHSHLRRRAENVTAPAQLSIRQNLARILDGMMLCTARQRKASGAKDVHHDRLRMNKFAGFVSTTDQPRFVDASAALVLGTALSGCTAVAAIRRARSFA